MARQLARHWWVLTVRGVLAIILGVMAFARPELVFETTVIVYGAFALVDGCLAIAAALVGGTGRSWGLVLVSGLAGIVIGILTLIDPERMATALVLVIGIWAVVTGVFQIAAAIRLRAEIEGEFWLGLSGLVSVLFGLFLIVAPPAEKAEAMGLLIGLYAFFFGVFWIALSLRLRNWHRGLPA